MMIDVSDFGVVGDGQTDNLLALVAVRDAMLRNPNARHQVWFPHGTYLYSNNRWLRGVKHVELLGNNSTFQCISSSPSIRDARPLLFTSWQEDYGDISDLDVPDFRAAVTTGYRIAEVEARESEITLTNPLDANKFIPGDWVCVHGFIQQWDGVPANLRYFEYQQIESVSGPLIRLKNKLRFSYSERWQDFTVIAGAYTAGAPRIAPMTMTKTSMSFDVTLRDMQFLPNPSNPNFAFVISAIHAELVNINAPNVRLSVGMGKTCIVDRCSFEAFEPDKLLEKLTVRDSQFSSWVRSGVGVRDIYFERCDIDAPFQVSPIRNLFISDCSGLNFDLQGMVQDYFQVASTRNVELLRSEFHGPGKLIDSSAPYVVDFTEFSGNLIYIQDTEPNRLIIRQTQIGTAMFRDSNLEDFFGSIVDMYFENDRHVLVLDVTIAAAQALYYDAFSNVYQRGNTQL